MRPSFEKNIRTGLLTCVMRHKGMVLLILTTLLFLPGNLRAMSKRMSISTSHPLVTEVSGKVLVKGQGRSEWEPVERGTLVLAGDVVRTGPHSRVRIGFASGSMELYEETQVLIPSIGTRERSRDIREIVVAGGRLLVAVDPGENGGTFRYRTGNVQGWTGGSLFTVSYVHEGTAVNIYAGEAQVAYYQDRRQVVSSLVKGSSLRVGEGDAGRITRFDPQRAVKAYGNNVRPSLDPGTGLPAQKNVPEGGSEQLKDFAGEATGNDANRSGPGGRS